MSAESTSPAAAPSVRLRVKYDDYSAKYASQVILNTSADEVFLDFSSGIVNDPANGEALLPVHTRVAMSHAAARRLTQLLAQAFPAAPAGKKDR